MNLLVENRADLPDIADSPGLDPLPDSESSLHLLLLPVAPGRMRTIVLGRLGTVSQGGIHLGQELVIVLVLLGVVLGMVLRMLLLLILLLLINLLLRMLLLLERPL